MNLIEQQKKRIESFEQQLGMVKDYPGKAHGAMVQALFAIEQAITQVKMNQPETPVAASYDERLLPLLMEAQKELDGFFEIKDDRVCDREGCGKKLDYDWPAIYCSNDCARQDA